MQLQDKTFTLSLRPLERQDLRFVHELNNDAKIMRYWFEEPYETFAELSQLYDQHVHDQRERRFVAVDAAGELVGLVELSNSITSIAAANSRSSSRRSVRGGAMRARRRVSRLRMHSRC